MNIPLSLSRRVRLPESRLNIGLGSVALLVGLSTPLLLARALHRAAVHPTEGWLYLNAWFSVAEAFWVLGVGTLGWLMAEDEAAGLLFLWGMVFTEWVTLAGATAVFLPWVYLLGSPGLVLLAATIVHFHICFPVKMEERGPLLAVTYALGGSLALAWILRPDLPYLRSLSRAYFVLALLVAWVRMYGVGRWWGSGLEEKWIARWLTIVLLVGGVLPTFSVILAEMLVGRALIPLLEAHILVLIVPVGYFAVIRRFEDWDVAEPISPSTIKLAVAIIETLALMSFATAGMNEIPSPTGRVIFIGVLAVLAYPLYRVLHAWVFGELRGSWYQWSRVLRELANILSGTYEGEAMWTKTLTYLNRQVEGVRVYRESSEQGKDGEKEGRIRAWVEGGGRRFGQLVMTFEGRRGRWGAEDRWGLEAVGHLLGMQLALVERDAQIARLREALDAERRGGRRPSPCPLSQREIEVLALVAAGKSDQEIADELHLSQRTVETHLQHIYRKLGVRNRAAAVAIAVGEGWIEPPGWYRGTKGNL